jgi:hypothetical protein
MILDCDKLIHQHEFDGHVFQFYLRTNHPFYTKESYNAYIYASSLMYYDGIYEEASVLWLPPDYQGSYGYSFCCSVRNREKIQPDTLRNVERMIVRLMLRYNVKIKMHKPSYYNLKHSSGITNKYDERMYMKYQELQDWADLLAEAYLGTADIQQVKADIYEAQLSCEELAAINKLAHFYSKSAQGLPVDWDAVEKDIFKLLDIKEV